MRVDDPKAVVHRLGSDHKQHDGAIAIDGVPARSRFHARGSFRIPLAEAVGFGEADRLAHELHFGLRFAEEAFEVLGIAHHAIAALRVEFEPGVGEADVLRAKRGERE